MIDNAIFLNTIIGLFNTLLLFYVVGLVFNYILNKRKIFWGWLPTYFYLLCGMLLSISFYSMYKTKLQTVLILTPIFLSFFSYFFYKQINFQEVKGWRKRLEPFLFLLLAAIIYYYYYFQGFTVEGNTINYIYGDVEYYARVAQNISQLGTENMRVEYLYPQRFTVEPYHYGDLWTIALAGNIAGVSVLPTYAAILVATPALLAISTLGAASFVHHFILKSDRSILLLLVIFLGFVGGFSFFFPKFLFPGSVDIYHHSLSNYTKLVWWASMLPLIFVLIMNKNDKLIPYIIFIIGFGYINVFPSLLMAIYIWLAYVGYKRGELKNYILHVIILTILCFTFFYIFYSVVPSFSEIKNNVSSKAVFSLKSIFLNYKTSINIFIGGGLQLLVYLPVALLLFVYNKFENDRIVKSSIINVILFSLVTSLSALCVWSLLYTTTFEAIQFFYNIFVVIGGLLSVVVYSYIIINSKKIAIQIAAILLFVTSAIGNRNYTINVKSIEKEEKNNIFNFVATHNPKTFAHYLPIKNYTKDVFSSSTVVAMPLSFLGYKIKQYQNFSLNVPFTILDSTKREYPFQLGCISWAPMSHFVKMPENALLSEDELMRKFMRTQKIGFLCLPINVTIPQSLKEFVKDSLYLPKVGWKTYKCEYVNNKST